MDSSRNELERVRELRSTGISPDQKASQRTKKKPGPRSEVAGLPLPVTRSRLRSGASGERVRTTSNVRRTPANVSRVLAAGLPVGCPYADEAILAFGVPAENIGHGVDRKFRKLLKLMCL